MELHAEHFLGCAVSDDVTTSTRLRSVLGLDWSRQPRQALTIGHTCDAGPLT